MNEIFRLGLELSHYGFYDVNYLLDKNSIRLALPSRHIANRQNLDT